MGFIYKVTNKIDQKFYIGKVSSVGKTLQKRKREHEKVALRERHHRSKFHNALKKYNFENFIWEILEDNISTEKV